LCHGGGSVPQTRAALAAAADNPTIPMIATVDFW
jgi:hypothetical protein